MNKSLITLTQIACAALLIIALGASISLYHGPQLWSALEASTHHRTDANDFSRGRSFNVLALSADFDADAVNSSPDINLPGPPDGDYLQLFQRYGTIRVRSSIGSLHSRPVEISHDSLTGSCEYVRISRCCGL